MAFPPDDDRGQVGLVLTTPGIPADAEQDAGGPAVP